MTRPITLDLSRLIWRAKHPKPSGIDRVERAYARYFLAQGGREARFIVRASALGARSLDPALLSAYLERVDEGWSNSGAGNGIAALGKLLSRSRIAGTSKTGITIIPSHQNWHRRAWLEKCRGKHGRLALFLHDTIPSDYPEYARDGGAHRHRQRLANGLELADAILVNSAATATALERKVGLANSRPMVEIVPLGVERPVPSGEFAPPHEPYFVCVGTIEPRKNHLLLLHLWRHFADLGVSPLPRLHIVGRRGWENENIVDLLDRSSALQGLVIEHDQLGDRDLAALLKGARALLMPSFTEGFGMPVNEALALGVPVIASDLPVYRETAGDIPEYLDPLDGPGWASRILDFSRPDSKGRHAQLRRLEGWQPPTWDAHFTRVEHLLERLD